MALQTNGVDVRQVQQLGIVAAVRLMTRRAARLFDGCMLVHPGAGQIRMAFQARGCLLRDARLKARFKCIVWIVTRGALNGTVVDLVMHRCGEFGLDAGMALVAQAGLRRLQLLPFLACMKGVATRATDVGGSGSRLCKVRVLGSVAGEAFGVGFFGRDLGRIQNLRRVAFTLNVRLAIAVTALASGRVPLRGARFAVRIISEMLDQVRVAICAGGSLSLRQCENRKEHAERKSKLPVQ